MSGTGRKGGEECMQIGDGNNAWSGQRRQACQIQVYVHHVVACLDHAWTMLGSRLFAAC